MIDIPFLSYEYIFILFMKESGLMRSDRTEIFLSHVKVKNRE
ncbi:hypothetical protein [Nostoc piscinale]|nr:hypothetical protein [Nostoc piscinale]